jgi:hypothetical protein
MEVMAATQSWKEQSRAQDKEARWSRFPKVDGMSWRD